MTTIRTTLGLGLMVIALRVLPAGPARSELHWLVRSWVRHVRKKAP